MGVRRAVLVAVVSPVFASAMLAGSAAPANASEPKIGGGGEKTGDVARVTGNGGKVLGVPRLARLKLRGKEVARGKGPIAYSFSTHSVPNGTYEASLQTSGVGLVWSTRGQTTLHLRAAPYTPSGVTAHRSGHTVTVHWSRGDEPDLKAYRVLSTAGSLGTKRSESAACGGSHCSATLHLPSGGSGRYGFAVRAYRSDGSGGTVGSASSNMHYVRLPAPRSERTEAQRTPNGQAGQTPSVTNSPTATDPGGGYLPGGIGNPSPYLPRSSERSPLKLPNVGPSGFAYPTPDKPRVAPPPTAGGKRVAEPSSAMTPVSPFGVGVAGALGLVLVVAHLLARWRLRIAARALEKAGMRAAARKNGHAWATATSWSKRAARRVKRVYHRERRRN